MSDILLLATLLIFAGIGAVVVYELYCIFEWIRAVHELLAAHIHYEMRLRDLVAKDNGCTRTIYYR